MALARPVILIPTSSDFITSILDQLISGTVTSEVTEVRYTYSLIKSGTPDTPVFGGYQTQAITFSSTSLDETELLPWSFGSSLIGEEVLPGDKLYVNFYSYNEATQEESAATEINVSFIEDSQSSISSPVPTGISVERKNTSLTVLLSEPNSLGFSGDLLGFNFYVSTTAGAGVDGYTRLNQSYITDVFRVDTIQVSSETEVNKTNNIEVSTTVTETSDTNKYAFELNKTVFDRLVKDGGIPNVPYTDDSVFYFTTTSLSYDATLGEVVESDYSSEIEGRFIVFAPIITEMPPRTQDDIILSVSKSILATNEEINMAPGSSYRDIIDPLVEEMADQYIIQDFVSRSQSLDALVAFDDADGDGESDPVEESSLKMALAEALKITNAVQIQLMIDQAFDGLASNYNVSRLNSSEASGKALFYVSTVPEEGLIIENNSILQSEADENEGVDSVQFIVLGSKTLSYASRESYYNPTEDRYEIEVDIESTVAGIEGNVPSNTINSIVSGADVRFRVTNPTATTNGRDVESNLDLANRAKLAFVSIDTGTEGGYAAQAIKVNGVRAVRVEKAGDSLMRRDILSETKEEIGGKVDIFVQGERPVQVQDIFAFNFGSPDGTQGGERFFIEDSINFRIRTNNPKVSAATPIFEVTRVYNATRSELYDISGAVAGSGDGDTIELAQNSTNLSIGMATLDVIEVDYRYRGSDTYVFSTQPVDSIVSVVGDIDGTISEDVYNLIKLEDPYYEGNSTIASDGIQIVPSNGIPTETFQTISNESHDFLLSDPVTLSKKGIDIDTIVVTGDTDGLVVYDKDLDYTVSRGSDSEFTELYLEPNGKIRNGSQVFVSYEAAQNFTVVYSTNEVLQRVDSAISTMQHSGADVIIKSAFKNQVDIAIQVIRKRNTSETEVSDKIRTSLTNFIENRQLGEMLAQDDIVNIVKNIPEVKNVTIPLTRMMKMNGSFIPDDILGRVNFQVYNNNTNKGITSYISVNPVLNFGTEDGGGDSNLFRGIYEDDVSLVLADTPLEVSAARGRGYIRADGKIIVSTKDGSPPQLKEYSASYYTYESADADIVGDITVNEMEHLSVGSNSLTIDARAEETIVKRGL
jgi:hypothetical protein